MDTKNKILPVLLLCSIIFSTNSYAQKETVAGELGSKIDLYMTRITPFGFSGALLAAVDGEVVLNKGYGMAVRSEVIPNTSETVFSAGSITKQFTASGIMKLEMMGRLNTYDLLSKYIEGVPEDKTGITLHHLLTHTAGIINSTGTDFVVAHRDETVKNILNAPLQSPPGVEMNYSNAGYSLLAAVIETVSGQEYEEFLNEHLFKPAGMSYTGYLIPDWDGRIVAHWYNGEKDNGRSIDKPFPYWNYIGNGGILSTTGDMYRWHTALLGDGILSEEAKKKLYTPFLNDYAYGWDNLMTEYGTLIQHDGGSSLGCSAEIRRYIDAGVVTMVFCNRSFEGGALFDAVRDHIQTLIFEDDVEVPPEVKEVSPEALKKYEGIYKLPTGGTLTASVENNTLALAASGQDALNALFFQRRSDLYRLDEYNKRSAEACDAAVKGNFEPFRAALADPERIDEFSEFVTSRIDQYERITGAIIKAESAGTFPSSMAGRDAVETVVQLKGEQGTAVFSLIWLGDIIIGMEPRQSAQPVSTPFLPVFDTEFAGYHLRMARNTSVEFDLDAAGSVSGMRLTGTWGDVVAVKER